MNSRFPLSFDKLFVEARNENTNGLEIGDLNALRLLTKKLNLEPGWFLQSEHKNCELENETEMEKFMRLWRLCLSFFLWVCINRHLPVALKSVRNGDAMAETRVLSEKWGGERRQNSGRFSIGSRENAGICVFFFSNHKFPFPLITSVSGAIKDDYYIIVSGELASGSVRPAHLSCHSN